MMLIIYQLTLISSIIFIATNHPMTLGFILMFVSIMFSIIIFLMSSSTWMSFILMIVFLSGSMVIFIYMTSISSNEIMSLDMKFTPLIMMVFTTLILTPMFPLSLNMKNMNPLKNLINSNSTEMIYKTYNHSIYLFTIFIIIYLLLMMIVAVKITTNSKAPLRA